MLVLIAIGDKAVLNSAEEATSPLYNWAAAQEDDAVLRALLQAGMRVDGDAVPLRIAPLTRLDELSSLLNPHARMRVEYCAGPVCIAAANPNDAVIRALLAAGAAIDDPEHKVGYVAARNPNERVIQALLDAGLDLNLCTESLLSAAAINSNLLVLRAVLASGFDVTKDSWAVASAASNPSEQAVEMLLAAGAAIPPEAVGRASANENERVIKALIRAGAPCDVADMDGNPLHIAAKNRNSRVLIALLATGVTVEATNLHLRTPVHEALLVNNVDALRVFLAAGVDLPRDRYESVLQMCFMSTAVGARVECAYMLLAAGYTLRDDDMNHVWHTLRPAWEAAVRDEAQIATAKLSIKKQRVDLVRWRAMEVCVALQSLRINALQLCEILQYACEPFAQPLNAFHTLWNIVTTVKHFRQTSDVDKSVRIETP